MSRTAASPAAAPVDTKGSLLGGYFKESETAWQSLVFLLPWIVIYEVGTWYFTFDPVTQSEQRIVAFSMLRDALASLGATARWIAPASVISILLAIAICRREPLTFRWRTQPLMLVESVVLTVPLLALGLLVARMPGLANPDLIGPSIVLSIGAGLYEELVFRLALFTALHFVLCDFLDVPNRWAIGIVLLVSAVTFSLYHYWGPESFAPQTFVFRTLAGLLFGSVLLCRGFGVTVGCHAAYDVIVSLLRDL